eukprot:g80875.t1
MFVTRVGKPRASPPARRQGSSPVDRGGFDVAMPDQCYRISDLLFTPARVTLVSTFPCFTLNKRKILNFKSETADIHDGPFAFLWH